MLRTFLKAFGQRARSGRAGARVSFQKFEQRAPADQNAVDLFRGKWASNLSQVCAVSETGEHNLFTGDERPLLAAKALGNNRRFDGMSILELGPLEAAHTYQLEQLGARSILAIEANAEAYLKCLVVKEILSLKHSRFMLGDFVEYLSTRAERFDAVFCSGVLYHMADPVNLIRLISRVTDNCFVWTHYYDKERGNRSGIRTPRSVQSHGFSTTYYELGYSNMGYDKFWGGNKPVACWMEREGILDCFGHFGLTKATVLAEDLENPYGACFSFAARRAP
jgi:SAM-dependent methyltransferase